MVKHEPSQRDCMLAKHLTIRRCEIQIEVKIAQLTGKAILVRVLGEDQGSKRSDLLLFALLRLLFLFSD